MKDLARTIALKLLIDFEEHHTFLNLALKDGLRPLKEERDRRFAAALVYGVVERKITLDHFIGQYTDKKLDVAVRSLLRMGIYQMFYMQVPHSAACNTSVDLIKQMGRVHSAGFINAILRKCAENKEQLLSLKKADFSVRYSISTELVDLLLEQYGKEQFTSMMEQGCGKDEATFLFCSPKKMKENDFIARLKQEWIAVEEAGIKGLFRCLSPISVENSSAYHEGLYHAVGHHSAMAAALIPRDCACALDLCAAPGGKTFMMAALIEGQVKAFDLHPHKVELLKKNAERLGCMNVCAEVMNGEVFDPSLADAADFVLCDVPCSGLGMIGKKPDIKYKSAENTTLVETQRKILCNGARYLKEGGRLVYSTCTIDRRENELQVRKFLEDHPEFSFDTENTLGGERLFLPGAEGDGFYIAVLKKGIVLDS